MRDVHAQGIRLDYERDEEDPRFVRVVLRLPMPLTVDLPTSVRGPEALDPIARFCSGFGAGARAMEEQLAKDGESN